MTHSSVLGAPDAAPDEDKTGALGPSDTSDSGSDLAGLPDEATDTDSGGTGERGSVDPQEEQAGSDVLPDEVVDEERLVRSHPGDNEEDATERR